DLLSSINIKPVPKINLDDIFLPENIKFHVRRMIHEIENYSIAKKPLRYLLNGSPGTGKTQVISSIIRSTFQKITTIVIKGTNYDFKDIFDFGSKLIPCLLIIDDLDFIAQDRTTSAQNIQLNDLLHALDGIYSTPIFFLAATNDKTLVDIAASRPGRFDLLIDFSHLSSDNYLQLIKRETDDPDLIDLFGDDILEIMSKKKVTGAFIVNLIKQTKSVKEMNGEFNQNDLLDLLKFSYEGFYETNQKSMKKVIGF
ncbi:MAG: ATP-binding protein, partial [Ignavibacteriaceae bacterium]|nr:ATP-binding protein [Ignavibacteriaceae bacterium]